MKENKKEKDKDKKQDEDLETIDAEVVEEDEASTENTDAKKNDADANASANTGAELLAMQDRYVRLQADFQNFRRRAEEDKQNTVKFANESLIAKLLSVSDDLDRALALDVEHNAFYDGIKLVDDELMRTLKAAGLEEIETDGKPFDPNLHHVVVTEESKDHDAETIIETYQKGYKLNGRVIRPAMVKVSK